MKEYDLYVESGPRRRTTMVHLPELMGCIVQGPTTGEALEATPEAIRTYLRFLRRHGEPADPDGAFSTVVAEHIKEGMWLGNGIIELVTDLEPVSTEELKIYVRRLAWLREDMLALLHGVPSGRMMDEEEGAGRSIYRILEHVSEAHGAYLRSIVGKVDGLSGALRDVRDAGPEDRPSALARMWEISGSRLAAMNEVERTQQVAHGQVTWTARRGLRRTLEHEWEHMHELSRRLGGQA
jgi:predicted RNase H-like HicB family nuclease